jgi:hypothetical protein
MTAVLADLEIVFEFAFEKVGFATVAFDEDVFRLHHALFRRDSLDALIFLIEPGHKNGGKGSTKIADFRLLIADCSFWRDLCRPEKIGNRHSEMGNELELDALLGANAGGERMLDFAHFRH